MLVLITPGFPENESDTTCLPPVQQMILALAQARASKDLVIVSLQYPFQSGTYYWKGIPVHAMGGRNRKGLARLRTWFKALSKIHRITKDHSCCGILSFWVTETGLIAKLAGLRAGLPVKYWIQGQDAKKENRYIRLIQPKPQDLLAISQFSRIEFERHHDRRPAYLAENGILEKSFPVFNAGHRSYSIMGAGSFTALKNYRLFLEILHMVNSQMPGLKFLLAGDGPLEVQLKIQAEKLGLSSVLVFTGRIPHAEVLARMNESHIFLHTSVYEGSSTVLAEALFMGCEVVSTIGLSQPEPQRLYTSADKEELAAKILFLLQRKAPAKQVMSHDLLATANLIWSLFEDRE